MESSDKNNTSCSRSLPGVPRLSGVPSKPSKPVSACEEHERRGALVPIGKVKDVGKPGGTMSTGSTGELVKKFSDLTFNDVKLSNKEHMEFIMEFMRTGDKVRSYMTIYPDSSKNSAYASTSRIMARKDVKLFMDFYMYSGTTESINLLSKKASSIVNNPSKVIEQLSEMAYTDKYPNHKFEALKFLAIMTGAVEGSPEEIRAKYNEIDKMGKSTVSL